MPTPMDNGYKLVAERHAQFVKDNPNGSVATKVVHIQTEPDADGVVGIVVMRCRIWKDRTTRDAGLPPDGEGHASMPIPGPNTFTKNSEVENAETSALGRALGSIGYHAKESMATEDEISMKKVERSVSATDAPATEDKNKATPKQKAMLMGRGMKLFGSEAGIRDFVRETVGVYKRTDLTRDHIDALVKRMDEIEATLGEAEAAAVGAASSD